MNIERQFNLSELSDLDEKYCINIPAAFVHDLAYAKSIQGVLDVFAYWMNEVFKADRASITLFEGKDRLKLYSIAGNHAIPMDFALPLEGTLVGRVFSSQCLIICDDLSRSNDLDCRMLAEHRLGSCMDAPLVHAGISIGTLNVAHRQTFYYDREQIILLQCLANWIAINVRLHQQLQDMKVLACTDELTSVFNRRTFIDEGRRKLKTFRETEASFYLGILDLDNFKQLNDRYGHDAGDMALREMTQCVKRQIRQQDLLARIGGEEFAVLLSACADHEMLQIFERIREAISRLELEYEGYQLGFTTSIGITRVQASDLNLEDIVKRADKALYSAKVAGRNRIVLN